MRVVGNILTTEFPGIMKNFIVNNNVLLHLYNIMQNRIQINSHPILKECLWAVSNIAADTPEIIVLILQTEGLIPLILSCCEFTNMDTRKEALWIVCNIITGAPKEVIESMLPIESCGVVRVLSAGLMITEARLLRNIMEAVERLLKLDFEN